MFIYIFAKKFKKDLENLLWFWGVVVTVLLSTHLKRFRGLLFAGFLLEKIGEINSFKQKKTFTG